MVDRFVSAPLELPDPEAAFARADLAFYDVDHSGSSFEARVFLDNADATVDTARDDPSYAGSFTVFGHGGCFGDEGHCEVPSEPQDPFDLSPPHQLTPQVKVVVVTQALRRALDAGRSAITVTVVAQTLGERPNEVLAFTTVRLLAYK
jgi:tyrosinase